MKHGIIVLLLVSALGAWGCAATRGGRTSSEASQKDTQSSSIVMDHFVQAKVFEFQGNHHKAIVELGEILAYDLASAPVYQALARDYLIVGKRETAVRFAEKAVQADPRSVRARRFLAMLYVPEKAIALLKALRRSPEVQMKLASVYRMTGQMEKAEALYRSILQEHPGIEEVAFALGGLLEGGGQKEEALSVYEAALAQRATSECIRRRLGELYMIAEQWDKAISHFEQLPQDPGIAQSLAMAYYRHGEYEKSRRIAQDALTRYGDDPALYYYLGRSLIEMEAFPEALEAFQAMTRLDESSADGWVNAGYAYLCMKRYAEAQALLEQGVGFLPHNSRIWFFLGVALSDQEHFREAVAALKKAVELEPDNVTYLFELGGAQDRAGLSDEGVKTFEKLLSVDPEHTLSLNYLGYLFADKGIRLDESLAMLKKAVAKEPQNGAFLDSLGWVYYRLGDMKKAERYIEQAAQLEQENAVIIEHLGDVANALGRKEEAKKQWKRSLELDPGNSQVQKKLELIGE